MRRTHKVLLGIGAPILVLVAFVHIAGDKRHDAPYPAITVSTDPGVIARGEYLVYGPAHCATCHVPMERIMDVENGERIPLSGGWTVSIPPGTLRAPNLTPDPGTGIGRRSDGELARILRHAVAHDGHYVMPVMPYAHMSDEDLTAVISFLRSQPPVRNEVPPTRYSFLGKALQAFGVLGPKPSDVVPPKSVRKEVSPAYGEYLAKSVTNCMGCHTEMDLMSGEFTKPPFAGGFHFEADDFSQGYAFTSPNLTPHPEDGIMAHWSEETFIQRFKAGRVHAGSPMPWGAFSRMDSTDLRAIHAYLMSLEPVANRIERVVVPPG